MSAALELGLAGLLLGWAGAVALVSGVAVRRALVRRGGAARPSSSARPSVVVVRPCAGLEPYLRRSLESTVALWHEDQPRTREHERPYERLRVVFSTSTPDDPARPLLLDVAASLRARGLDATVVVAAPRGPNLKASQLAGLLDEADDDVALVIDSDVELERRDAWLLLAPLRDAASRTAAVWCPPIEREPASLGDRMSAALLGGSLHAFALLGTLDPRGLVGKAFAVRLAAVREVGGFGALVQHLGEDMELARRLRARGHDIEMAAGVVASLASRRSAAEVLARYARWLMVIRAQRPLLLAATPGLVLCSALGLVLGVRGAGVAMSVAVVARLVVGMVAATIARRAASPFAALRDAVLADGLLLAAFARALGPARVRWRDRSLRLGRHGVLEPG